MGAKNPRINITLGVETVGILSKLADREHKSVAGLTKELILEALERREDLMLSEIASSRDMPGTKQVKHDDAWG